MSRKRGSHSVTTFPQQLSLPAQHHHHHPSAQSNPEEGLYIFKGHVFNRMVDRKLEQAMYLRCRQEVKREFEFAREKITFLHKDYKLVDFVIIGFLGLCLTISPLLHDYALLPITPTCIPMSNHPTFVILQLVCYCCFLLATKSVLRDKTLYPQSQAASTFREVVLAAVEDVHQDNVDRRRSFGTLIDKYKPVLDQCTEILHSADKLARDLIEVGIDEARSYQNKISRVTEYLYTVSAMTEQVESDVDSMRTERQEIERLIDFQQVRQQEVEDILVDLRAKARNEREELKERLRQKEVLLHKKLDEIQSTLKKLNIKDQQEWVMCSHDDID